MERLSQRAGESGILALVLRPQLGDFNDDLLHLGRAHLAAWLGDQLVPDDEAQRPLTVSDNLWLFWRILDIGLFSRPPRCFR
ncbi:hypothetical protein [Rhizobium tropici]|uniref:hypothetical protein n=1 Tax=Rhizobium TaxID=379 RepID=UPI0035E41ECF